MPSSVGILSPETEKGGSFLSTSGPPRTWRLARRQLLRILLPSFLVRTSEAHQDDIRPTDFLDGMRGYAAFIVFFYHFIEAPYPFLKMAYGGNKGVNDDHWIQLPILRLLYSGQVCVTYFFVISGFSISLKPPQLARNGTYTALTDYLVSAIFRRPCRLYLPSLAVLLLALLMSCCGAFDMTRVMLKNGPFVVDTNYIPPPRGHLVPQVAAWIRQVLVWADPLSGSKNYISYGSQLWTIPVELQCSLTSFIAILGLAKVRSAGRLSILVTTVIYLIWRRHHYEARFLAGTCLAELFLIRQERSVHLPKPETQAQKLQAITLFALALLFGSYPATGAAHSRFWSPLRYCASFVVAKKGSQMRRFFLTISSILLVGVVSQSRYLQALFNTRLARYLGKTSFALYCVHDVLLNWFGLRSIGFFWIVTGNDTPWSYGLGVALSLAFLVITTIWASDLFWRFVDLPSMKFAKWLEKKAYSTTWSKGDGGKTIS